MGLHVQFLLAGGLRLYGISSETGGRFASGYFALLNKVLLSGSPFLTLFGASDGLWCIRSADWRDAGRCVGLCYIVLLAVMGKDVIS